MRRVLTGLVVAAVAALSLTAPAAASPGQVFRLTIHGPYASAMWNTETPTGLTYTQIELSKTPRTPRLVVAHVVENLDQNGEFVNAFATQVDVSTGFDYALDSAKLTAASVHGTNLPGEQCTEWADKSITDCHSVLVAVDVTWLGQGPTTTVVENQRLIFEDVKVSLHSNETRRDATVTGSLDGIPLVSSDLSQGQLGTANYRETDLCIGTTC